MATTLTTLETTVRYHLNETTARFWTSAELVRHMNDGIKNLWGAIIDLYEEHYLTVDITNVSIAADATTVTGVPSDTFRIHLIEPRDTTADGSAPDTEFVPRDYNSYEFRNARALTAQEAGNGLRVFYAMTGAGAPVAAPTVQVAPKLSAALNLRFVYVPTIPIKVAADDNPIPGESDQALIAYCTAFALAKDNENKMPDPGWLSVYATEKEQVLARLKPRQSQEPVHVEDMFGAYTEG